MIDTALISFSVTDQQSALSFIYMVPLVDFRINHVN